ncbi:hypothetical protein AKN87_01855 [Thiopseudomonas alkaliphila]|nr:hypothetical protein AKN87_01855 [Thiopseudomonas alkaliphila]
MGGELCTGWSTEITDPAHPKVSCAQPAIKQAQKNRYSGDVHREIFGRPNPITEFAVTRALYACSWIVVNPSYIASRI